MTRKIPPKLKVLSGTFRKDRDSGAVVELTPLDRIPNAPDWLPNAHAVKEFDRLAQILHANKMLNEASVMGLATLCALHGKIVQQFAAGTMPTGHMISQYRMLLNDFGLTPMAQGKIKQQPDDGKKENKFSQNGQRPRPLR